MRLAVPVSGNRVAPKATRADAVWILELREDHTRYVEKIGCAIRNRFDLIRVLQVYQADTLVCGSDSLEASEAARFLDISVIDNVSGPVESAVKVLGVVRVCYGN